MHDLPASTEAWQRIRPSRVRLDQLTPTQPTRPEWVQDKHRAWWRSHSGDIYVHAVRDGDRLLVVDGHHRIQRERDLARTFVWARVFDPGLPEHGHATG